ncbi:MAG: ABC transporter substrate-binding protein [Treponema sp.]|nr:ABC transporter substrate-binding protein [Candidatus Treponema equifaecale]
MKRTFLSLTLSLFAFGMPVFAQKIGVLNGPSGIPCGYLMEQSSQKKNSYEFEKFASAQMLLPKLLKGEIDIGFLPPNAAAKVFNSGNKALTAIGISGNGNLYLMTTDQKFKDFSELAGKTVVCAGMGATPEYMFRYLLKQKKVQNVNLDFSIPNPDIAASLVAGKYDYALVPEPFATVSEIKGKNVRRISIQKIFTEATGMQSYPMTLVVCNSAWAKKNGEAVAKFAENCKEAVDWTVQNPDKAGQLSEKHQLGLASQVVQKAVPNSFYTWKNAKDGRSEIEELLKIFLDFAPNSIGGKLPGTDFYWQ